MAKKILIVDDEASIRDMFHDLFEGTEYEVIPAVDAAQALEILKKDSIYVIFLDIRMPGMNGLELCRVIRAKYPISCLYAITGYSSVYELADCRAAGFDDYFLKPIDTATIIEIVDISFRRIKRWSGQFH